MSLKLSGVVLSLFCRDDKLSENSYCRQTQQCKITGSSLLGRMLLIRSLRIRIAGPSDGTECGGLRMAFDKHRLRFSDLVKFSVIRDARR